MKKNIYNALERYFVGQIEKHRANVTIHANNPTGVAEHSDHIETIEKELGAMAEWDDKLQVLISYFRAGVKDKEVING